MKLNIKNVREDGDEFHSSIYFYSLFLAAKVTIEESIPGPTGRQQFRNNVPAFNPFQYHQRVITILMLEFLSLNIFSSAIVTQILQDVIDVCN